MRTSGHFLSISSLLHNNGMMKLPNPDSLVNRNYMYWCHGMLLLKYTPRPHMLLKRMVICKGSAIKDVKFPVFQVGISQRFLLFPVKQTIQTGCLYTLKGMQSKTGILNWSTQKLTQVYSMGLSPREVFETVQVNVSVAPLKVRAESNVRNLWQWCH